MAHEHIEHFYSSWSDNKPQVTVEQEIFATLTQAIRVHEIFADFWLAEVLGLLWCWSYGLVLVSIKSRIQKLILFVLLVNYNAILQSTL